MKKILIGMVLLSFLVGCTAFLPPSVAGSVAVVAARTIQNLYRGSINDQPRCKRRF